MIINVLIFFYLFYFLNDSSPVTAGIANADESVRRQKFISELDDLESSESEKDVSAKTFIHQQAAKHRLTKRSYSWDVIPWPNKTVFYKFDDDVNKGYSKAEKTYIRNSMDVLEASTCVNFFDYDAQKYPSWALTAHRENYVLITRGEVANVCGAEVGYVPRPYSKQTLVLADRCLIRNRLGFIEHELMHVLGADHEHSRPDRDSHIKILWHNIREEAYNDFNKRCDQETYGLPYDYSSIMQYDASSGNIFKLFGSSNTMEIVGNFANNSDVCLGQRIKPSHCDFELIRHIYDCNRPVSNICRPNTFIRTRGGSCKHVW